jgi:hypothetical protein
MKYQPVNDAPTPTPIITDIVGYKTSSRRPSELKVFSKACGYFIELARKTEPIAINGVNYPVFRITKKDREYYWYTTQADNRSVKFVKG